MLYGYSRVSLGSCEQDSPQNLSRQILELKKLGVEERNIFKEYASGTKEDRVELKRLFDTVKEGDTIISLEVSRITRSTKHYLEIIELARKKHLKLIFGSMVLDFTQDKADPFTSAMLMICSVFASLERDVLSERVKSGLFNARSKGVRLGRRPTTIDDIPNSFFRNYQLYKGKKINKRELAAICNLSYPSIYKYISIVENK